MVAIPHQFQGPVATAQNAADHVWHDCRNDTGSLTVAALEALKEFVTFTAGSLPVLSTAVNLGKAGQKSVKAYQGIKKFSTNQQVETAKGVIKNVKNKEYAKATKQTLEAASGILFLVGAIIEVPGALEKIGVHRIIGQAGQAIVGKLATQGVDASGVASLTGRVSTSLTDSCKKACLPIFAAAVLAGLIVFVWNVAEDIEKALEDSEEGKEWEAIKSKLFDLPVSLEANEQTQGSTKIISSVLGSENQGLKLALAVWKLANKLSKHRYTYDIAQLAKKYDINASLLKKYPAEAARNLVERSADYEELAAQHALDYARLEIAKKRDGEQYFNAEQLKQLRDNARLAAELVQNWKKHFSKEGAAKTIANATAALQQSQ